MKYYYSILSKQGESEIILNYPVEYWVEINSQNMERRVIQSGNHKIYTAISEKFHWGEGEHDLWDEPISLEEDEHEDGHSKFISKDEFEKKWAEAIELVKKYPELMQWGDIF